MNDYRNGPFSTLPSLECYYEERQDDGDEIFYEAAIKDISWLTNKAILPYAIAAG